MWVWWGAGIGGSLSQKSFKAEPAMGPTNLTVAKWVSGGCKLRGTATGVAAPPGFSKPHCCDRVLGGSLHGGREYNA